MQNKYNIFMQRKGLTQYTIYDGHFKLVLGARIGAHFAIEVIIAISILNAILYGETHNLILKQKRYFIYFQLQRSDVAASASVIRHSESLKED